MRLDIKYILATLALGSMVAAASAAPLTVEDYCDISKASAPGIKEMRPLADGVSYAAISADGKAIEKYSYKTGKKIETLFSINEVKGDVKITEFDGYEISANGRKILLWNDSEKIYRYSFTAEYFVYDTMRKTMQRVSTGGKQRCAVLSNDGRMVAYERGNNIYISNLDYGTDRQITEDGAKNKIIYGSPDWGYEEEFGVQNTICWSADDNTLAFIRFDESEVPEYTFDIYSGYCEPIAEYDLYPGEYSYKYPLAGFNNSRVSVIAHDVNNRVNKVMDLPIGEKDYVPSLKFGAGGTRLMVMILNRDQNSLQLFSVNPGSTVGKLIYTDKSSAWLSPQAYQMSEYGDKTFIIGSEKTGYRHLYEYDYNGNPVKTITKGDFNVTAYYGKDAKGNYFLQCTKLGAPERNVAKVDSRGVMTLLHDNPGYESASFSSNMEYYVRTYSNTTTPPQYTIWTAAGSKISDLELNAEYAARYASAPKRELLKVKNAAGEDMNAYIIKPADFDPSKKYPLMMYQYNGPDSQEVLDNWRMEGIFYIASQGYIVAAVDGRGTGNRSREWANVVYKQLGKYETADQLAGAAWFASLPYVDEERTSCFGWSYGGYMTLMELSDPACKFKCGVSMAPVTDWRFYDSIYTERYMLTPQQNAAGYKAASALEKTAGMNSKLLIMSGTADDNVHFYNTLKYTSKLTSEGKIFDMMAYTAFEHSLRMCNARTQLFKKVVDFLDTRLK